MPEDNSSAEARALSGSSNHSLHLRRDRRDSRRDSSSSRDSPFDCREEKQTARRAPARPNLIYRTNGRRGKVGGLSRDIMMRRIRGFFRWGHETNARHSWKVKSPRSPVHIM
ncbi:hypothetical protein ACRALDRAFT_1062711, partial [Sodiomyces alcalophilus JCM 7366]|uniref:uncharacterized protein n=1 Tax=Sodiomyces alcalophilus JCM 7366 TaxID=591952 RepID=UPI0039B43EE3